MTQLRQIALKNQRDESEDQPKKLTSMQMVMYWLIAFVVFYTLYIAQTLFLPVVVAALFALLLSPLVRILKRFYIPRSFSALLLLASLGVPFTLLGMQLVEPAERWAERIPELSTQLTTELNEISEKLALSEQAPPPKAEPEEDSGGWFGWFSKDESEPPKPEPEPDQNAVSDRFKQGGVELMIQILGATPVMLTQFFTFVILVVFMLVFGPLLYSNFISGFTQQSDKQAANSLLDEVQRELSRYILTVSVINTGLGIVTGAALWAAGVQDALLWGVMVALLNFAPYVGPIAGMMVLYLAGIIQYGANWMAFIPPLIFFGINTIEAQFITPTVLGHNMRLNPLILILWLILWGWMWGAVGVLIAVPLLVCLKLAAARLNIFSRWVKLIETPG